MRTRFHTDVDSAFVASQLEQVRAAVMAPLVAPLKAATLIPWMQTRIDRGCEVFTYRKDGLTGRADFVSDYAADLPLADALTEEASVKLYSIGDGFTLSLQEMYAAKLAGTPLDTRKALAARRAIDEKLDSIARAGDADHNLKGLLNLAGTCTYTVPADGTGVTKTWSTKSGALITRDMHGIVQQIIADTNECEAPDTLVVPPAQFNLISTTPYGDYDSESILAVFLAATPYIKQVVPWTACDAAGVDGTDRMVAYRRDPSCLEFVGVPTEMLPTQTENAGLIFKTALLARCAGVVAYRPKSVCFGDGI